MTRALMTSSQVAVTLSLNVVTMTGSRPQIITLPLADLTPILLSVWSFWLWLDRLIVTTAKLTARAVFTGESIWDGVTLWLTLAVILVLAIGWSVGCQKPLSKTLVKNSERVFCAI